MKATIVKPGILLLDDGGARYARGKGYEPKETEPYTRWPWVEFKLDLTSYKDAGERARLLASMIRETGEYRDIT
jgi:hypothetical protein